MGYLSKRLVSTLVAVALACEAACDPGGFDGYTLATGSSTSVGDDSTATADAGTPTSSSSGSNQQGTGTSGPASDASEPTGVRAQAYCSPGAGTSSYQACPDGYVEKAFAINTVCSSDCTTLQTLCLRMDLSATTVRDSACPAGQTELVRASNYCPNGDYNTQEGDTIALCLSN